MSRFHTTINNYLSKTEANSTYVSNAHITGLSVGFNNTILPSLLSITNLTNAINSYLQINHLNTTINSYLRINQFNNTINSYL